MGLCSDAYDGRIHGGAVSLTGFDRSHVSRYFEMWGNHSVERSLSMMKCWVSVGIHEPHVVDVSIRQMRYLARMMEGGLR